MKINQFCEEIFTYKLFVSQRGKKPHSSFHLSQKEKMNFYLI